MTRKELTNYCSLDSSGYRSKDIEWIESTPGTVRHLWNTCTRVDFMLWLARHSPNFDPSSYTALVNLKAKERRVLQGDYEIECRLLDQALEIALCRAKKTGKIPLPMRTRDDLIRRYGTEPAGSRFNERVAQMNRRYNKKLANAIRHGVSWSSVEGALHYFYAP